MQEVYAAAMGQCTSGGNETRRKLKKNNDISSKLSLAVYVAHNFLQLASLISFYHVAIYLKAEVFHTAHAQNISHIILKSDLS
jgi:hypothetical protein